MRYLTVMAISYIWFINSPMPQDITVEDLLEMMLCSMSVSEVIAVI